MVFGSDEELIRSARSAQNQAMEFGNFEQAASYWTDDVTLRRALGSAVTGKAAYQALLNNSILYLREPELIEVSPHWPLAFESGHWKGFKEGQEVIGGRYSAQWVKRGDRWLIRSEVFVALSCGGDPLLFSCVP